MSPSVAAGSGGPPRLRRPPPALSPGVPPGTAIITSTVPLRGRSPSKASASCSTPRSRSSPWARFRATRRRSSSTSGRPPATNPARPTPAVRVAEQDDDRVLLAAYRYRPDAAVDAADACPEPGFAAPVTLDLGSPLDGRRVVEDGTDHVLALAG